MPDNQFIKFLFTSPLLVVTGAANANYEMKLSDQDKISFGGFIKVDFRYVNGDVAYRDYWLGSGTAKGNGPNGAFDGTSKSQVNLNANETRFNMRYTHNEVMGFIELDFIASAQGNEVISNSASPRLRHAFIKYESLLVGQSWTTFMNTSAIPEAVDLAGPANGLALVRQAQIRYSIGNLQVAFENPFTFGGDDSIDNLPDITAKYTFKGDWGNVSIAGLTRRLHTESGISKTSFGYSVAGRIKTLAKDDIRFQIHGGNLGRYVGIVSAHDVVGEEVEETTSYLASYRHFWTDNLRTTLAYGYAKANISTWQSKQWSVNLFKNLTKQLSLGAEIGNFSRDDKDADSNYGQLSIRYVL